MTSTLGMSSSSPLSINGNAFSAGTPTGYSPPVDPTASTPSIGRKVKRKGQIRHAYAEKVWGLGGWTDVGKYLFPGHMSNWGAGCSNIKRRYEQNWTMAVTVPFAANELIVIGLNVCSPIRLIS
jgi:hypothetical protein